MTVQKAKKVKSAKSQEKITGRKTNNSRKSFVKSRTINFVFSEGSRFIVIAATRCVFESKNTKTPPNFSKTSTKNVQHRQKDIFCSVIPRFFLQKSKHIDAAKNASVLLPCLHPCRQKTSKNAAKNRQHKKASCTLFHCQRSKQRFFKCFT